MLITKNDIGKSVINNQNRVYKITSFFYQNNKTYFNLSEIKPKEISVSLVSDEQGVIWLFKRRGQIIKGRDMDNVKEFIKWS